MMNTIPNRAVEMKITTVLAGVALLQTAVLDKIDSALRDITGGDAEFFDGGATIADVTHLNLTKNTFDWSGLRKIMLARGLRLVAVRNAPLALNSEINDAGLAIDSVHSPHRDTAILNAADVVTGAIERKNDCLGAMIISTPVRAGQSIYAKGRDLIVTAVVNNGAEIIADGHIHVYAALKGRALAGASGNTDARIFALSMEAELVSIAGVYRTFDDGFPAEHTKHPAQVILDGSRIDIVDLNPSSSARF
jgi:septum site-determining protein MinC